MSDWGLRAALVKVGGSLLDWPDLKRGLSNFLLAQTAVIDRTVLVVGGGRVVDTIRDLDRIHGLGDLPAHRLAIEALDITAQFLGDLLPQSRLTADPDSVKRCWRDGVTPIIAPGAFLRRFDPSLCEILPATWDITSDSIAAQIALRLELDRLILLKSTDVDAGTTRSTASTTGFVDPMFAAISRPLRRVEYRNLRNPEGVITELPGEDSGSIHRL